MQRLTDPSLAPRSRPRVLVDCHETLALSAGWQAACSSADRGYDAAYLDGLSWIPARVPGTAAGALRDAGLWRMGELHDFDAQDWWFRTSFDAEPAMPGEEVSLRLDGIATVAEVYLNGERLLDSDSMFVAHELQLGGRLTVASGGGAPRNELAIRCRALGPLLGESRRPRARWRTRLVPERNLRFFRTMLIGRAPGFAPGPATVGPWRAVRVERRRGLAIEELALRPRIEDESGVLSVLARLRPLDGAPLGAVEVELDGPSGTHRAQLELSGSAEGLLARGELIVPQAQRWWPHTHGEPALHDVRLLVDRQAHPGRQSAGGEPTQLVLDAGRIGFRELAFGTTPAHDILREGLDLHVNGVRVFARGAVWTPIDPIGMAPSEGELRMALLQARDAGMNMLRLPGTSAYETTAFYDLCDELGILVWQDFMFANFDYPLAHQPFRVSVTREATEVLSALGGRASLAVMCGNSEVEQQAAMLGLEPSLGRGELFGELLSELVRESGVDAAYVPSAPCGGELPFRPDHGIANYYGVGGYRRPLEDARRAGVRFAAECLAFSNLPSETDAAEEMMTTEETTGAAEEEETGAAEETIAEVRTTEALAQEPRVDAPVGSARENPVLKTGTPRDAGADWDFADIRDHYLALLFDVDPSVLYAEDRERYLELGRATTGEVMAEVFGEWRRAGSPCGGGLVLWLRDLLPGAGWGVVDHCGAPKLAYHHLKRALAPVAVWTVDEGLGGVVAHVANDGPAPLSAALRVALYRDGELLVEQAATPVQLGPHSQGEWNVETVIGHFTDASWAYRFGPPAQDAIVVSLEHDAGPAAPGPQSEADAQTATGAHTAEIPETLCQAIRFPAGRPRKRETLERLGLDVETMTRLPGGEVRLELHSRRLAYGVRVKAPGLLPSDDGFFIEPGGTHDVTLRPRSAEISLESALEDGVVTALNMHGHLELALQGSPSIMSGAASP
jgi:beta-mannosidase